MDYRAGDEVNLSVGTVLGSIVSGWKIRKLLGRGTYGAVYECESVVDKKVYAIKVSPLKDSSMVKKPAKAKKGNPTSQASRLIYFEYTVYVSNLGSHPQLPYLPRGSYDEDATYRWLCMQKMNETLKSRLVSTGNTVPYKTIATIAMQLLDVLGYIHSLDWIHTDLNAENVMLGTLANERRNAPLKSPGNVASQITIPRNDDSERVFLLDFGLATHTTRINNDQILCGTTRGTPMFSSYLAVKGQPISARFDLDALGYLLLYLAVGPDNMPWSGATSAEEVLKLKQATTPENLSSLLPSSSPLRVVLKNYFTIVFHSKNGFDLFDKKTEQYIRLLQLFEPHAHRDGVFHWHSVAEAKRAMAEAKSAAASVAIRAGEDAGAERVAVSSVEAEAVPSKRKRSVGLSRLEKAREAKARAESASMIDEKEHAEVVTIGSSDEEEQATVAGRQTRGRTRQPKNTLNSVEATANTYPKRQKRGNLSSPPVQQQQANSIPINPPKLASSTTTAATNSATASTTATYHAPVSGRNQGLMCTPQSTAEHSPRRALSSSDHPASLGNLRPSHPASSRDHHHQHHVRIGNAYATPVRRLLREEALLRNEQEEDVDMDATILSTPITPNTSSSPKPYFASHHHNSSPGLFSEFPSPYRTRISAPPSAGGIFSSPGRSPRRSSNPHSPTRSACQSPIPPSGSTPIPSSAATSITSNSSAGKSPVRSPIRNNEGMTSLFDSISTCAIQ